MSRTLYNHTNGLRDDFMPYPRPAKYLKSDLPGYPGGVPYLSDSHINPPGGVLATPGEPTNGRVQVTLRTRTRDQKNINKYQFAWIDTIKESSVVLLSLPQMNKILATDPAVRDLPLSKILDRFHLYGVVANNDADTYEELQQQSPRAFSITVWGASQVYDYWSSEQGMLQPYDSCFFVLKKVRVPAGYSFQIDISVAQHDRGVPAPRDLTDNYMWQIVPVRSCEEFLTSKDYCVKDPDTQELHIGMYWKVGHAHEYAQIATREKMASRKTPMDVARDISYMHMNASVSPIQFYVKILQPKILVRVTPEDGSDIPGGGPPDPPQEPPLIPFLEDLAVVIQKANNKDMYPPKPVVDLHRKYDQLLEESRGSLRTASSRFAA